jgi:hypothetical protein
MTAYVLAANATLRDIGNAGIWGVATARTGGDTIDTNGFNVTIDQDTRYGLSGAVANSLGSITINATKGGQLKIDATKVWLVPYTTGSGTLTAGTAITLTGVTCNTIGLYSAFTAAPVLTGVATGWLKVTNASGTPPSSGTFTQAGFTFTISGAPLKGFIEVVGDEAATINANRLGSVNMTGDWFEVGTTSGSSATTYQLPTNGSVQYYPAIWVETGTGTDVYEAYPCAGSLVAAASTPTDAIRGKVCWATTGGVLRFGSDGTNTVGYVPPSGRRIRLPNILLVNCTTAARATNALPNATLATRYDFTCTGGGVINMDKVNCLWYPSFAQAYSTTLSYVGIAEQLSVSEIAQPLVWNNVAVGQVAAQANIALVMSLCFAGGTISNCAWSRATQATALAVRTLTDISGFTFSANRWFSLVLRAATNTMMATDTRVANSTFTNEVNMGMVNLVTCTNITYTNTIYYDCITTTTATNPLSAFQPSSNCNTITIDGLSFGGLTNVHPYNALLTVGAAGCTNIKLRNIGSYASPLNLGSANACGLIYTLAAGAAASDVKVQRVYCSNTRTGIMTGDNSSTRVLNESIFGDYADAADVSAVLNFTQKGLGTTKALTAQTAIYGTHWLDYYTSTTAGRLAILMNETTGLTAAQVALTNGAAFTSAGGLYMPTVGMTATFETPEYIIGHTGFSATAGTMAGGTVGNYRFEFAIDKNDGAGFSAMSAASYTAATLATAMNALTGISAINGFKLRLKISTTTANTTAITSFYMLTTSTTTTQAYQYPLDTITLSLTGLVTGSDAVVRAAGASTILASVDANAGSSWAYTYETPQAVDIDVIKPGYVLVPLVRNFTLPSSNASLPVSQLVDRNYA